METPFPGMDPYLEHPALWPGVHTRLVVALANQIAPEIRPRYKTRGYDFRVLYDEPCKPPLSPEDQEWASAQWSAYRQAHPELFPDANSR